MRRFLPVIVIVVAVFLWQRTHQQHRGVMAEGAEPTTLLRPEADPKATSFKCDGRVYCSQMTSCAEATYFLQNCPNVKMDGNRDGVPCERQWCGTK